MYRWSVCDPLVESVIEKGRIRKEDILSTFKAFPWVDHLSKMETLQESQIHFSPSLEFANTLDNRGLTFSAIQEGEAFVFYIFYMRPEKIKKLFGLIEKDEPRYVSDLLDQSFDEATEILKEFIDGKYEKLCARFV